MPATFTFQKAERRAVKLKIGVDGPSGSGKTMGALAIAHGITGGGRVAVADSENGSASLYANRFAFDTVIVPDALPETYKAIIDAAAAAGYEALVIDSLSHAWLTVLAEKEDHDRKNPKSNSWTNWRLFGPRWDSLMQHILQAPLHVIATMRSKQAYEQVDNGGRKQVVKLGLQPQVRDGAEYEFGLVYSVDQSHQAEATKDRTGLFFGRQLNLCDPKLHQELVRWMNAGGPVSEASGAKAQRPAGDPAAVIQPTGAATPSPAAPPRATPASNVSQALTRDSCVTWGKMIGMAVKDLPIDYLRWAIEPGRRLGPDTEGWQRVMRTEVDQREMEQADSVANAPAGAALDDDQLPF